MNGVPPPPPNGGSGSGRNLKQSPQMTAQPSPNFYYGNAPQQQQQSHSGTNLYAGYNQPPPPPNAQNGSKQQPPPYYPQNSPQPASAGNTNKAQVIPPPPGMQYGSQQYWGGNNGGPYYDPNAQQQQATAEQLQQQQQAHYHAWYKAYYQQYSVAPDANAHEYYYQTYYPQQTDGLPQQQQPSNVVNESGGGSSSRRKNRSKDDRSRTQSDRAERERKHKHKSDKERSSDRHKHRSDRDKDRSSGGRDRSTSSRHKEHKSRDVRRGDKESSRSGRDKHSSQSSDVRRSKKDRSKKYKKNRNEPDKPLPALKDNEANDDQPDFDKYGVVEMDESEEKSRFDSRSNMLKRRPVSGVPLSLQKKMENGDTNISSHLKLITAKETAKSSKTAKFLRHALKKEVLFDGLTDEIITDIVKVMYLVRVPEGDIVIQQGEYGDAYFVVEKGAFHVMHQETPQSQNKVVGECSGGDAFGEGSLLYSIPRAATLKAKELSIVWALDAATFIDIRQKMSQDKNEKTAKIVKFLKKISLFTNYNEYDLTQIAQAVHVRTYKKADLMVKQGADAKEFFVIKHGQAQVSIRDAHDGAEKVVAQLKGGDFFGERGIFLNAKRAATIEALKDCKCYVIEAPDFKNLLEVPLHESLAEQMKTYDAVNFEKGIKQEFVNRVNTPLLDLKDIGILGVGSFGRVSLVQDPLDGATYSLKKVRKNKVIETGQEEHVRNERAVLGALDSDFCCKLYATYQDKLNIYFLMEAVLGGELFTVLRWNKRFSEKTARFYAACVVLAFEHLHNKNIIYRDLKPENLLIASNGYCKLVDFGFAKRRNNSCTLCGTPEYLAPEVIQNYPQGFAVDWWELGIFIYEMVVGHAPFQDDPHMKMYEKILTMDPEFPNNLKFTDRVVDVCNQLLAKDVFKRLGAGIHGAVQVKKHVWFTGLDWEMMEKQQIKPPYTPRIQNNADLSNFETYPEENIDEQLLQDPDGAVYQWCEDF